MSKQQQSKIRAQRTLKHFKNVQQTKAGNPDTDTVKDLLADLKVYCELQGLDLAALMPKEPEPERETALITELHPAMAA